MKSACIIDKDSLPRCERYVPECDFCIRDEEGNCIYSTFSRFEGRICLNCNAIAAALETESVYMRKLRGAVEDRKREEWEALIEEARYAEVE